MQPPEGPPVCTALKLLAVGNAAADLVDDLAQRDAHGHFDQAGIVDAARQREDLGALALLRADGGEPIGAVAQDGRDIGEGLDVVDQRGAAPQAFLRRIGRPRPRRAALAFDRGDQRRLLAADEGAGAEPDVDVEAETRCRRCCCPAGPGVSAWRMAVFRCLTASGYSART